MADESNQDGSRMELAAMEGDIPKIRELYSKDPFLANHRGKWDWTPLMRAADQGQNEAARVLIDECHAKVDLKDRYNHSALHIAATEGHEAVVVKLLHSNADVNDLDDEKRTPLMLASFNGHSQTVRVLIAHRAEMDRKNSQNKTAKQMAKDGGRGAVYKLLDVLESTPPDQRDRCHCQEITKKMKEDLENLTAKVEKLTIPAKNNHGDEASGGTADNTCNNKCDLLQKEVTSLKAEFESCSTEVKNLPNQMDELWAKVTDLENDNKNMQEQMSDLRNLQENGACACASSSNQSSAAPSRHESMDMDINHGSKALSHRVLDMLAREIGNDKRSFGTHLGFDISELNRFDSNSNNNALDSTFDMLVAWQRNQDSDSTRSEKLAILCEALKCIKRKDLQSVLKQWIKHEDNSEKQLRGNNFQEDKKMEEDDH